MFLPSWIGYDYRYACRDNIPQTQNSGKRMAKLRYDTPSEVTRSSTRPIDSTVSPFRRLFFTVELNLKSFTFFILGGLHSGPRVVF